MSIVIYTDYEEFSYSDKEICDFIEDQSVIKENSYDDEEELVDEDFFDYGNDLKIDLRSDASYYIICDEQEEELGEDVASYLGKSHKFHLKTFDKIFFYVI